MQGSDRKSDWRKYYHWVLWWKIDAEELRRQVEGYDTLGVMGSVRGEGFVLATAAGITALLSALCILAQIRSPLASFFSFHETHTAFLLCFTGFQLAAGLLSVILGVFLYRGSGVAILGMMTLWTIYLVLLNAVAPRYLTHEVMALLFAVSLPAWARFMHAWYATLIVERQRKATA